MTRPTGVLCYVSDKAAYFTTAKLSEQWADDWDDSPYEHNAGEQYSHNGAEIHKVYFDGPFETPADMAGGNSRYSVQAINRGDIAWLTPSRWDASKGAMPIQAGTEYQEFVRLIHLAGGTVYEPINKD